MLALKGQVTVNPDDAKSTPEPQFNTLVLSAAPDETGVTFEAEEGTEFVLVCQPSHIFRIFLIPHPLCQIAG